MCSKILTEEDCVRFARHLNLTVKEVFSNPNHPFPSGCYVWTPADNDHGIYYNSALTGNVNCTANRECLCAGK